MHFSSQPLRLSLSTVFVWQTYIGQLVDTGASYSVIGFEQLRRLATFFLPSWDGARCTASSINELPALKVRNWNTQLLLYERTPPL